MYANYIIYSINTLQPVTTKTPYMVISLAVTGINEEDPGMVPDGSLCGPDKWCKSQKCVQVPILPKHCSCNQVKLYIP